MKPALVRSVYWGLANLSMQLAIAHPTSVTLGLMRRLNRILTNEQELRLVVRQLKLQVPCDLLIFGVGFDSGLWTMLNRGGTTVFIEDNVKWADRVQLHYPEITVHIMDYNTVRSQWRELIDSPTLLELGLPEQVTDREWDVVIVDGPSGWEQGSPGRMKSIALARKLVRAKGHVFVHDCDREVERAYCDHYLGASSLVSVAGRMRHYSPLGRRG